MIWSTHLRCAAVALFAMAVSYAVSAWAIPSVRAFTDGKSEHRWEHHEVCRAGRWRPTTSAEAHNRLARVAPWCSSALDRAS